MANVIPITAFTLPFTPPFNRYDHAAWQLSRQLGKVVYHRAGGPLSVTDPPVHVTLP